MSSPRTDAGQPGGWTFAAAKLNLALHVTGRRDDGYHLLDTLVVFADIGDRLRIRPADRDSFAISGPFASALDSSSPNLVTRARDLVRAHAGIAERVAIELEKNLPVASGLGGGSADAAATIRALCDLWHIDVPQSGAIALGADLPMCLDGGPLLAGGIGETIEPVAMPALDVVLVNPTRPVATPAVFAALARRDNPPLPGRPPAEPAAFAEWLRACRNDLQDAAISLEPSIADCLAALDRSGASVIRMSGSGASCFGLYAEAARAKMAAEAIARAEPGWFVRATTTGASRGD